MTGGIIIAVLTVYKDALGQTLTTNFNAGFAVVFLRLAAFGAWREQKVAATRNTALQKTASEKLQAQNEERASYQTLINSLTAVAKKGAWLSREVLCCK